MRRDRLACMHEARSEYRVCAFIFDVCLELPSSSRLLSALLCYSKYLRALNKGYISMFPFENVDASVKFIETRMQLIAVVFLSLVNTNDKKNSVFGWFWMCQVIPLKSPVHNMCEWDRQCDFVFGLFGSHFSLSFDCEKKSSLKGTIGKQPQIIDSAKVLSQACYDSVVIQ